MKTKFYKGLQFRFSLLIIISSIPILLLTYLNTLYDKDSEFKHFQKNVELLVNFSAENEAQIFDGTRQLLISQAAVINSIINDKKKLKEHIVNLKNNYGRYQNLGIINKDGRLIVDALPGNLQKDFAGYEFFIEVLKNKKFLAGPYEPGINQDDIIYAALPVLDQRNELKYIIFAALKKAWLYEIDKNLLKTFYNNTIFIRTDDEGYILESYPHASKNIINTLINSAEYKKIFGQSPDKKGSFELKAANNEEYYFVFSTPKDNALPDNFYFFAGVEKKQFLSEQHKMLIQNITYYGLVFFIILMISWYLIKRYILDYINLLINSTNRIASGNYSEHTGIDYKINELGELAASFDKLVDNLEQQKIARDEAEKSLRLSEKRFREILENIKLISIMLNTEGRIIFVNDYLLNLTGWTRSEIINKNWYDLFLPEDLRQHAKSFFLDSVKTGSYYGYKENYILTRSGERRLIAWNNTIITGLEGEVIGTTSIGEDITERKKVEEKLRISEERIRTVINNIPMTLFATDKDNIFILHEGYGILKLGMKPGENVGKSALELFGNFPFEERNKGTITGTELITRVMKGETINAISRFKSVWFDNHFAPSFDAEGNVNGLVGVALDITERIKIENDKERLYKEVKESKKMLQKLTQRLFEVQEKEKRNLSRELHDEIGQILTAIKINIQNAAEGIHQVKIKSILKECIGFTEEVIEKIRNISLTLRPPLLDDLGLIPSLRSLIKGVQKRNNINIEFETNINGFIIDQEMKITLYRITQEAVTNIIRHSNADQITINLSLEGKILSLKITDNGKGFDVQKVYREAILGQSAGILSMKERTELIGGSFNIVSSDSGTVIFSVFQL